MMFPFLASLFPIVAAMDSSDSAVIVATGAAVLAGLWAKMNAVKKGFVEDVLTKLKADEADRAEPGKTHITNQPFVVEQKREFASSRRTGGCMRSTARRSAPWSGCSTRRWTRSKARS